MIIDVDICWRKSAEIEAPTAYYCTAPPQNENIMSSLHSPRTDLPFTSPQSAAYDITALVFPTELIIAFSLAGRAFQKGEILKAFNVPNQSNIHASLNDLDDVL
ncbi:hypothetical protein ACH5RR_005137 [Cinchona calisaya]|uniref:Symbiotic receptor-like kinase n=1 Tax=Cinchona calisaya TaxID=153742 RepID=A0ABD3AKB4_9GENT